jgi:hypothetical protein
MARKCPPGVICFENVTIFIILSMILILIYFYTREQSQKYPTTLKLNIKQNDSQSGLFTRPRFSYTNFQNDVLLNPYEAPLRDDRYFPSDSSDPRGIPINVSTRSVDTTYRQVGILKKLNGDSILPLMGRPLFTNRDKWNFYTMNENNIKLPVTFKQKSCTNEYGCDNVYNGDTVYVDGIDAPFKATIYDNATMKYIPYL